MKSHLFSDCPKFCSQTQHNKFSNNKQKKKKRKTGDKLGRKVNLVNLLKFWLKV